jgi:hypothetical protein
VRRTDASALGKHFDILAMGNAGSRIEGDDEQTLRPTTVSFDICALLRLDTDNPFRQILT